MLVFRQVWLLETDLQIALGDSEGHVDCFRAVKVLYLLASQSNSR